MCVWICVDWVLCEWNTLIYKSIWIKKKLFERFFDEKNTKNTNGKGLLQDSRYEFHSFKSSCVKLDVPKDADEDSLKKGKCLLISLILKSL